MVLHALCLSSYAAFAIKLDIYLNNERSMEIANLFVIRELVLYLSLERFYTHTDIYLFLQIHCYEKLMAISSQNFQYRG